MSGVVSESAHGRRQRGCPDALAKVVGVPGPLEHYYLVAHAHAHGHTVVTHERPENSRLRVKIPNACDGMNVPWVNTFQMLSATGVQFVIAP